MLPKLTLYLNPRRIFSHLLVPAAALALYSGAYAFFSARLLPAGVNTVFASRLSQYALIALAAIFVIFVLSLALRKDEFRLPRYALAKLSASDLVLLLLPLTPVAQYVIKNRDILTLAHSLYVLGFFVLFCAAYIFLIPLLLGRLSSTRLLMVIGLAFTFTITSMSSLSLYFHWINVGSLKVQLIFLAVVFLFCWVLSLPKNKSMFTLLITLIFIANSAMQMFTKSDSAADQPEPAASANAKTFTPPVFAKQPPASAPNIYLLVYDAYPQTETMQAYGIDNTTQDAFLEQQGFVLYPHTYSVGSTTLETMGSVLNTPASIPQADRWSVSGGGSVQRIMRDIGYQTYGVFPYDYLFQKTGSSYDVSFPAREAASYAHLISATLMGEFRFDIGFDDITHEDYVAEKQRVFADTAQKHVFLYSHSNVPGHTQNSGKCLPDEAETWKGKLKQANAEMRQDVEIITRADPHAIIIVAGDHGPYLTKNCYITEGVYPASEINRLDIQDRYGTYLAIRWPTADYAKLTDIRILQDVFPSIFAYLYKDAAITGMEIQPVLLNPKPISGVMVKDGIIIGGKDNGEPLFLSGK